MNDERETRLAGPIAVAAGATAACATSITRFWLFSPLHGPVTIVVAMTVGACVGHALARATPSDPLHTRPVPFGAIALAGPVAAVLIGMALQPDQIGSSALVGAAVSLVLVPMLWIAFRLAHAALRSRARSVVGGSDRRAFWRAAAVYLAVIAAVTQAVLVHEGGEAWRRTFWWGTADRALLARVTQTIAILATAIAMLVVIADAKASRILARARVMRLRAEQPTLAEGASLDVGVGEDAWVEASATTTYRSDAGARVALRGDLAAATELLSRARRRSRTALVATTMVAASVILLHPAATH